MKILIVTANGYDDYELFYPYFRCQEAGIDVDIAAAEKGTIKGNYFSIEANKSYKDIKPEEYQALYLPGGSAPEIVRMDEDAKKIVQYFIDKNIPVASICHGQQTLISINALKGKSCTCYMSIKDDVINAGAIYKDLPVVIDGSLITSRFPPDLPVMMKSLLEKLQVK